MTTISLKLPDKLLLVVETEAKRRGVTKAALIRNTLDTTLPKKVIRKRGSAYDLIKDLVGTQPGPRDASTNPRYLEEAVMMDYYRGRKHSR